MPRSRCSSRDASPRRRPDRRRRLAWRRRQDPRRRRRSAIARSSAPARWCATMCRRTRSPSASRRASSAAARRSGRMSGPDAPAERAGRKLNVLQVCDHLGWEGSRMHGVKRLFAWMIPRFDPQPLQRLAGQPAQEGPVRRDARRARHRHHLPAPVQVRSGDADRAAQDHRSQADRHPAPARLRRDDVRAARRRDARAARRSSTSTPISPTRRGSRKWPIGCSSRIPTSPSPCRRAPPTSSSTRDWCRAEKVKVVYLGVPLEEFSRPRTPEEIAAARARARHSRR